MKKYDKLHDSIQYNEHEKDASGEFRKNYRYTVTVQEEDCQDMEIKEEEAVSQGTAAPFSTEEAEEVFRVDPLSMDWCRTETGHYDADQVDYSDGGEDSIEETPFVGLDEKRNKVFYGMPSWGVLKFSSSFQISNKTKASLVLDNLLDIHYREFASGISSRSSKLR